MVKPLMTEFQQDQACLNNLPAKPRLSSGTCSWNSIHVAYYSLPGCDLPEHSPGQHTIVIHHQSIPVNRKLDGNTRDDPIEPGAVVVVPAQVSHGARWQEELSITLLMLEPDFLAHIAYEFVDPDQVEILPHFAQPDPFVYRIGQQLQASLAIHEQVCSFFVENTASLLAIHLLKRYGNHQNTVDQASEKLSQTKQRLVVEYINTHLDQSLGLQELAQLVQMSQAHFTRQFKQATGVTPYQYLIQCRLERAKTLLANTDLSITAIAQKSGFSSHSHLSRLFSQHLSITPRQYRQMHS